MPNHLHAIILVGATLAVAQIPTVVQNVTAVQNPVGATLAVAHNTVVVGQV
jgi:hypothetical protein